MAEAFRTLSLPGALSQFKTISLQPLKIRVGNDVSAGARPLPSRKANRFSQRRKHEMLWTIFVILLVLSLVGLVSSYTMGGFIHLLLVLAIVVLIIQLIGGRRPL